MFPSRSASAFLPDPWKDRRWQACILALGMTLPAFGQTVHQPSGTLPASPWSHRPYAPPTNPGQPSPGLLRQPSSVRKPPLQLGDPTPPPRTDEFQWEPVRTQGEEIRAPRPEKEANLTLQKSLPGQVRWEAPRPESERQRSRTDDWNRVPQSGMSFVSTSKETGPWAGNTNETSVPVLVQAVNSNPTFQDQWLQEQREQSLRIGSQVSREILDSIEPSTEEKPLPIEPPTGWGAIEKELKSRLERCDDLLRRKAVLSGKQEILVAIRILVRALDQRRDLWQCEPHLDLALQAFQEEEDFHASLLAPESAIRVEEVVSTHHTPVLKNMDLQLLAPDTAAQYYHQYAKDQLVAAADRHGFAADLYYALGKCLEREVEPDDSRYPMYLAQSAVCFQAALLIRSNQSDAASELGYVLLKLDRNREAMDAIQYAIKLRPTVAAYQNLAELHRRSGDSNGVQWAMSQVASLQPNASQPNRLPYVQEVSPEVFAQMSPREFGMVPSAPMAPIPQSIPAGEPPSRMAQFPWMQRNSQ